MKPGPKKRFEATLRVRVSMEAMEELRRKAMGMGLTLSEFLRLALGEVEEVPTVESDDAPIA